MKTLLTVIFTCIAVSGCATPAPMKPEDITARTFATVLEAATYALRQYTPVSLQNDESYLGAVVRDGDRYRLLVSFTNRTKAVVAMWHTHGRKSGADGLFSGVDTQLVYRMGIPMYLGDYTRKLKVFSPEHTTIKKRGHLLGTGYGEGEFVLDQAGWPIRL